MAMEGQVYFNYKARYHKLGEVQDSGTVWVVLHGYGQLSGYFIQKFEVLHELGHCIIAPEALSRFYLSGFHGRVGATWMTREDRENDIENYLKYLNTVFDHEIKNKNVNLNILGFSQGAATASRWVTQSKISFKKLVLWAGIFPPDMDIMQSKTRLEDKQVFLTYGTLDKFITHEKLQEQKDITTLLGVKPSVITFKGEHEIDSATLLRIANWA